MTPAREQVRGGLAGARGRFRWSSRPGAPIIDNLIKLVLRPAAFVGAVGLLLYLSDIGCVFRAVTGVPCPGCGMTRAWLALLRGDVASAIAYHPLFWAFPLALGVVAAMSAVNAHMGQAGVRMGLMNGRMSRADVPMGHADARVDHPVGRADARVGRVLRAVSLAMLIALVALWAVRLADPADGALFLGEGHVPADVPVDVIHVEQPAWLRFLH